MNCRFVDSKIVVRDGSIALVLSNHFDINKKIHRAMKLQ